MKELTSNHDDLDKRLAIFFGLGAFIMSALIGLLRGYTLEGMLLQGVVVLTLATLGGWLFGWWLRAAIKASAPKEETPAGVERRTMVPASLEESTVVVPSQGDDAVISEEVHTPLTGSGREVTFTLPELNPAEEAALNAIAAGGIGGEEPEGPTDVPAEAPKAAGRK